MVSMVGEKWKKGTFVVIASFYSLLIVIQILATCFKSQNALKAIKINMSCIITFTISLSLARTYTLTRPNTRIITYTQ